MFILIILTPLLVPSCTSPQSDSFVRKSEAKPEKEDIIPPKNYFESTITLTQEEFKSLTIPNYPNLKCFYIGPSKDKMFSPANEEKKFYLVWYDNKTKNLYIVKIMTR